MTQPAIPPTYGAREAQPLDTILDQVAGNGWNFFAGLEAEQKMPAWAAAVKERAEEAARAAAVIAGSPEGRILLEYLADVSVRRPVFVLGMKDEALAYAAHREGQNALFYTLLALVAEGRQEQPTVREGT